MKAEGWLAFLVALILIGAVVSAKNTSGSTSQQPGPVVPTVSGR